jgi:hypothetical protein
MSNDILASLLVRISADTATFGQGVARAQTQLASFTSQVSKMAGQVGLAFGAFQAFSVVKSAVKSITEFEKELSTVRAITNATDDEFKKLKKSALDLGASTRYTSKEVAGLQVEYGRLGFTTKEILAATSATLDLATATGEDLAKSADVAGSTIRGFGLDADESRRVVDVMAEAFNKSALSLSNFSEAMKYVAPIAAANNISLEETTAMLGVLADAGIRGSMAGTSLRKVISDLKGETGTLAERLQKLADRGISSADAMDEVGRTAYASLLILAKNTDKTRELTEELNNSAGAGKEAARIMGDNLAGDVVKLSSAYDGLIQSAGEGSSVLREVTQDLTSLLAALNSNNGALGGFIAGWARLITVVPRFFLDAGTGITRLVSGVDEANAALKEQEAKTALIAQHVYNAFAQGREYVLTYIKALGDVPNKIEIISAIISKFGEEQTKLNEEVLKPQIGIIEGIEAQLKLLEDAKKKAFSEGEIMRFNVQIANLKAELEALNASHPLSNFGKKQLADAKKGVTTEVADQETGGLSGADFLSDTGTDTTIEDPLIKVREGIVMTDEMWKSYYDTQRGLREEEFQHWQQNAQAALEYGEAIGGAISEVISGQQSAMGALKKLTGEILKMMFQRAMAGIISSATQTPGPPPVVLAAAAAGMAVIAGLFSKIGGGGGGKSAGGGMAASSSRSVARSGGNYQSGMELLLGGEFRIRQGDLVAVLAQANIKNQRVGG